MRTTLTVIAAALSIMANNTLAQGPIFEWVKATGDVVSSRAITVDDNGNVYVTGFFSGSVDFDPGPEENIHTCGENGTNNVYIQKLDNAGNFLWATVLNGGVFSYDIATDAKGNVYITGSFEESVDFDPGAGTMILTPVGSFDIYVLKLDNSGKFLWVKSVGGVGFDVGQSLTTDGEGNVYVTGDFWSAVDFDPGEGTAILRAASFGDAFVLKLDSDGNYVWAKSSLSPESATLGRSIIVDDASNVIVAGVFRGYVYFGSGPGVTKLTSVGLNDIYIEKLDSNGNFLWAKSIGGVLHDYSASITTDAVGNVYITGGFKDNVDFDPGEGDAIRYAFGDTDLFVEKLDADGNFQWVKTMGNLESDYGSAIAADAAGNLFVTGNFDGKVDFDPGYSDDFVLTSKGRRDIFILFLDTEGNIRWASSMGDDWYDAGFDIDVDNVGNIYVTGEFSETVDFDPGTGSAILTTISRNDMFVLKLSSTTVGVTEQFSEPGITVYPNPVNDQLIVDNMDFSALHVELSDIIGNRLVSASLSDQVYSIDMSAYAAGVYFVTLNIGKKTFTRMVVKN